MTLTSKMQDVHRFSVILSSNSLCWASRIVMRLFLVPSNYIYICIYSIYIYQDSSRLIMTMPWAPSHFANFVWILHFPRTELNWTQFLSDWSSLALERSSGTHCRHLVHTCATSSTCASFLSVVSALFSLIWFSAATNAGNGHLVQTPAHLLPPQSCVDRVKPCR